MKTKQIGLMLNPHASHLKRVQGSLFLIDKNCLILSKRIFPRKVFGLERKMRATKTTGIGWVQMDRGNISQRLVSKHGEMANQGRQTKIVSAFGTQNITLDGMIRAAIIICSSCVKFLCRVRTWSSNQCFLTIY